jgi:hypothetical protein
MEANIERAGEMIYSDTYLSMLSAMAIARVLDSPGPSDVFARLKRLS